MLMSFAVSWITRSLAMEKRPSCYCCVGQFWPNVTGRRYFADIIVLSSTTVTYSACKAVDFGEITQNKSYYAVQGHSRSSMSVSIESPYVTTISDPKMGVFHWLWPSPLQQVSTTVLPVINSKWHPISYSFGVIADYRSNFGHCVFEPPLGVLGTTYDVHLVLIGKRLVHFLLVLLELFYARCYGWGATSENR